MASNCQASNDNSFGPIVEGCRSGFDFTLLFEQTILSIGPSAMLLLFAPPRFVKLLRSSKKTLSGHHHLVKTVCDLSPISALRLTMTVRLFASNRSSAGPPGMLDLEPSDASSCAIIGVIIHSQHRHSPAISC